MRLKESMVARAVIGRYRENLSRRSPPPNACLSLTSRAMDTPYLGGGTRLHYREVSQRTQDDMHL